MSETVLSVVYSPLGESSGLKVLECPPELIACLEAGKTLTLRGGHDDVAVLCTDAATFSVRQVETSNTSLLLAPIDASAVPGTGLSSSFEARFPNRRPDSKLAVVASHSSYIELAKIRPVFDTLALMLHECPYEGPDEDERRKRRRRIQSASAAPPTHDVVGDASQPKPEPDRGLATYTLNDILDAIQASEGEIRAYLESSGAVLIDGCWRVLSPEYSLEVLELVMLSAIETDMDLARLSLADLELALESHNIPNPVLERCLRSFSESFEASESTTFFKLSHIKVCRLYGEQVLRRLPPDGTSLISFLKDWRAAVPEIMDVHLDQLAGVYLLEGSQATQIIRYFPKSTLPSVPKARFEELFKIRKKWLREDLIPYVSDLTSSDKDLELMIIKNARISKQGTRTFLTSRFTAVDR
ncbi:Ctf8p and Ctf18p associating protein [Polyrhizophydium stewartii]|uniref:Ctf8p and Ctf18p associating protein n=1 Tax=Polyrhizophydium stewartii TaxID=2732419 RepID=A0ABR4NGZ7_9FUNG